MTHGLNIFNALGGLSYSSTDVTWNQVDFFYLGGGGYVNNNYPILAGREVLIVQTFINPPPLDRRAIAHYLTASGINVSGGGGSEAAYILVLMR